MDCSLPGSSIHGIFQAKYWSGVPLPSPMHESEKGKGSRSVVSDSLRPHGLQPTRLLRPWIFQARVLEWGAIAFSSLFYPNLYVPRELYSAMMWKDRYVLPPHSHLEIESWERILLRPKELCVTGGHLRHEQMKCFMSRDFLASVFLSSQKIQIHGKH